MPEGAVTTIEPHDDVLHVVVLKRSLKDEATRTLADDVLSAAAARPHVPIVLDLTAVRFVPSVGLGTLVQLTKSLRLDGRRIALIGVDERVMNVIRVTRLHQLLEIHDTLEQVVEAKPKAR